MHYVDTSNPRLTGKSGLRPSIIPSRKHGTSGPDHHPTRPSLYRRSSSTDAARKAADNQLRTLFFPTGPGAAPRQLRGDVPLTTAEHQHGRTLSLPLIAPWTHPTLPHGLSRPSHNI